ncbi:MULTISPECIES: tryptophan synthase subunit alpha [Deefgea]|uniref:Tryptophan synthase alpha chain n=1 Tax=Deefgea chitinilytica TaxID=570276 RepID=A0ABS2CFR6_9NEIS|nr:MULTISPECIES: tryptophan synthase subunit alpha [Deefgea]MBM5573001.1 tryptophan synthase subunit alpha [Deefgea chitinilytica]MBM9890237.1 tryptophan synthase subunit alpha [Deefgea sp. CFH1-16]
MSRISTCFAQLDGKKALIPFITAGDPHPSSTVSLMHTIANAGADIIELGVPFSDPMADGEAIQRSYERALDNNTSLHDVLQMVSEFRKINASTPVVLMGYMNPICAMGISTFARAAKNAGLDGVLVVDCPPEEAVELSKILSEAQLDLIFLLAPTTTDARVGEIARIAKGYVYYVSLKGTTGASNIDVLSVEQSLARFKKQIKVPIGVGFGISNTEIAAQIAPLADAVIVGSRIINEMDASDEKNIHSNVDSLIKAFNAAVKA